MEPEPENLDEIAIEPPRFEDVFKDDKDSIKYRSPDKPKRWITRAMAEDFDREELLRSTLKESVIYIFFVIFVTVGTVGARNTSEFFLTETVKNQFLETTFSTTNYIDINFNNIKTISDFWHYVENIMTVSFYPDYYEDPEKKSILYGNRLLGVPRMRQVKVRSDSCEVVAFKNLFSVCYGSYQKKYEDRETFGLGYKTAWVYSTPENSDDYKGKISTYGGGGFYQDLNSLNLKETLDVIKQLKNGLWISRATRAVFVDFTVYNPNLNLFCVTKLIFEFPPTGNVVPSSSIRTMFLLKFSNITRTVVFIFECVTCIFLAFYCLEEIREIKYFRLRYFKQFWSYIDLLILLLGIGTFTCTLFFVIMLKRALEKVIAASGEHYNLDHLARMKGLEENMAAGLLFFVYIKIFKYLNFNKTMGQLNNTLKRCALDILAFSVMFFIIFMSYADLGFLLFGDKLENFSNLGMSMFTLLCTNLGIFDYPAIESANPLLAPLYFFTYIVLVFFILMNMFLAIINDAYADVKTEIDTQRDQMQMLGFIKMKLYNLLKRCGLKIKDFTNKHEEMDDTSLALREAFKKCGFSQLEIEMFFARYNIDPFAEVGEYDTKGLLAEMETIENDTETNDDVALVQLGDFITQQERLDAIDKNMKTVIRKIDALIRKLEILERY